MHHSPARMLPAFFLKAEMNSVVYLCHIVFWLSRFGYLGWFQNLVIVNRAAVNIGKQCQWYIEVLWDGWVSRKTQADFQGADLAYIPICGPHPHHSLMVLVSEWLPFLRGVEPQYGFVLFLWRLVSWPHSHMLIGHLYFIFWICSFHWPIYGLGGLRSLKKNVNTQSFVTKYFHNVLQ